MSKRKNRLLSVKTEILVEVGPSSSDNGEPSGLGTMFRCSLCCSEVEVDLGVVLMNCHHTFCRECIYGYVKYFDEDEEITCPYKDQDGGVCKIIINRKDANDIRVLGQKCMKCASTGFDSTYSTLRRSMKNYNMCKAKEKLDIGDVSGQEEAIQIIEISDDENCFESLKQVYEDCLLVKNSQSFECTICTTVVEPNHGVVLKNCLHTFCKTCLCGYFKSSQGAAISCPYVDGLVRCAEEVLESEIREILSPNDYAKWLQMTLQQAERAEQHSFHCQTVDCDGWCICDPGVSEFLCPCCLKCNCLRCEAVHDGMDCVQYQDHLIAMAEIDSNVMIVI